jgi:hypothetical protein
MKLKTGFTLQKLIHENSTKKCNYINLTLYRILKNLIVYLLFVFSFLLLFPLYRLIKFPFRYPLIIINKYDENKKNITTDENLMLNYPTR